VAVFCDNDEPQLFSETEKIELEQAEITVIQWDKGNSTEQQIFSDIPWEYVPAFIGVIIDNRDFLEIGNLINAVKGNLPDSVSLSSDPSEWTDSDFLRAALGKTAKEHRVNDKDKGWIKRIDCAEKAFEFLLPKLPPTTSTRTKLQALWHWIQNDG